MPHCEVRGECLIYLYDYLIKGDKSLEISGSSVLMTEPDSAPISAWIGVWIGIKPRSFPDLIPLTLKITSSEPSEVSLRDSCILLILLIWARELAIAAAWSGKTDTFRWP